MATMVHLIKWHLQESLISVLVGIILRQAAGLGSWNNGSKMFDGLEMGALQALEDTIFLTDDHLGAWDAGFSDYLMRQLSGDPVDWPIRYEGLVPNCENVEWESGNCGDHRTLTHLPVYGRPYPMPALPQPHKSTVHEKGLEALGWRKAENIVKNW